MNVDLETGLGTFFLAFITSLFLGWFFVIFTKESTLLSIKKNYDIYSINNFYFIDVVA